MRKTSVSSDEILDIYLQVAQTAIQTRDRGTCQKMLQAAYSNTKHMTQKPSAGKLSTLGDLLLLSNEIRMAEEIYNLAISCLRCADPGHRWLQAKICDGLSEIYALRSEHIKARKACQRTVHILEKTPSIDPELLASRMRKLAWIHMQDGTEQKAIDLVERANQVTERGLSKKSSS